MNLITSTACLSDDLMHYPGSGIRTFSPSPWVVYRRSHLFTAQWFSCHTCWLRSPLFGTKLGGSLEQPILVAGLGSSKAVSFAGLVGLGCRG